MNVLRHLGLVAALVAPTAIVLTNASTSTPQDEAPAAQPSEDDMAAMMAEYAEFVQPGPEHELLGLLVGEWDVETRFTMMGSQAPAEKGTAITRWKYEGRWIESEWTGRRMGMPGAAHIEMGYDRMKQSYVYSRISNMDTALYTAEGDLTQDGETLILWGTLDEWMTGEHDKVVKYVHRFDGERNEAGRLVSIDRMVLEVHDMAIGESNTKVLEFTYVRK